MASSPARALILASVLVGLLLLGVLFLLGSGGSSGGTGGQPGQTAPLFATTDLSGAPVTLSSYRGHRVI